MSKDTQLSPQEKEARRLIDKFIPYVDLERKWVAGQEIQISGDAAIQNARKCATILCNEILKVNMAYHISHDSEYSIGSFYELVKKEIKKVKL